MTTQTYKIDDTYETTEAQRRPVAEKPLCNGHQKITGVIKLVLFVQTSPLSPAAALNIKTI